jgi:uncharacterized circularly permuted ATP-grasp superfamily protein
MGGLLDRYPHGPAYDEMFGADGLPHPHTRALYDALQTLTGEDLARRAEARDRSFRDQGVVFSHAGEEWVFPLDLIPRLIPAAEWELVEAGVVQRVRALEAFLADVYGPAEVVRDGVVPRSLLTTSAGFCRPAHRIEPPNGVRVHLAGIDIVRDQAGLLRVLEDNLQVPSGMSYVVENRRTMARVFPGLFLEQQVRPVAAYPGWLLDALRQSAPVGAEEPVVVLLTPGVGNPAYFEHAFLARKMGVELVEGRDLFCRDNIVYMRSVGGQQRVDVVYRRVNDDFLDPVHFRADSVVGCPGIVNAARAGNVTIANAVGNGVADDKLTYTYLPALIEYYLGERPGPTGSTIRTCGRIAWPGLTSWGSSRWRGPAATASSWGRRPPTPNWPPCASRCWPRPGPGSRRSWCCCRPRRRSSETSCCPGTSTCGRSRSTMGCRFGCRPAD